MGGDFFSQKILSLLSSKESSPSVCWGRKESQMDPNLGATFQWKTQLSPSLCNF